jgi:hypothetical protein
MKHYNDNEVFEILDNDVEETVRGSKVSIPIYWGYDHDGNIMIDTESMMEEFQRTVTGIEIVIDDFYDQ